MVIFFNTFHTDRNIRWIRKKLVAIFFTLYIYKKNRKSYYYKINYHEIDPYICKHNRLWLGLDLVCPLQVQTG